MGRSRLSDTEGESSCRLFHNSHRTMKFLLSVFLFSALISLRPLVLESLMPFLMQFDSYAIGKSYMFLLCNGILVLVAKNSGLINGSPPSTNHRKELHVENPESIRTELKVLETGEPKAEIEYAEEDKSSGVSGEQEENEEEWNNALMIIGKNKVAAEETEELHKKCQELVYCKNNVGIEYTEEDKSLVIEGVQEDNDDGASGEVDADELNKKCENFIRRMKTAFFIETRFEYYSEFDYQKALMVVDCK